MWISVDCQAQCVHLHFLVDFFVFLISSSTSHGFLVAIPIGYCLTLPVLCNQKFFWLQIEMFLPASRKQSSDYQGRRIRTFSRKWLIFTQISQISQIARRFARACRLCRVFAAGWQTRVQRCVFREIREICVRVIHWLYENREYNLHEYFWCVCPVRLWSAIGNKRKNRRDKSFGYTSGSYRALCIGKAIAPSTIMCRKIYSKANCTHIIT